MARNKSNNLCLNDIDQSLSTTGITVKNGSSFSIPAFNYQAFTYVGSTNNISTQVFKSGGSGGTTVATLTFTYVNAGVANDDNISSITQS